MFEICPDYQYISTPGTVGVAVTPAGSSWTWSNWYELIAVADADLVITSLQLTQNPDTEDKVYEIELGVGAAGMEVGVGMQKGYSWVNLSTGFCKMYWKIGADVCPLGSRLAIRMRKTGSATHTYTFKVTYLKKPLTGTLSISSKPLKWMKPASTGLNVTCGASWAAGSWTTMIANTSTALVITHFWAEAVFNGFKAQIELGVCPTGAIAGSEVQVDAIFIGGGLGGHPYQIAFPNPLDMFPAASRISVRASAATAQVVPLDYGYLEKPL